MIFVFVRIKNTEFSLKHGSQHWKSTEPWVRTYSHTLPMDSRLFLSSAGQLRFRYLLLHSQLDRLSFGVRTEDAR